MEINDRQEQDKSQNKDSDNVSLGDPPELEAGLGGTSAFFGVDLQQTEEDLGYTPNLGTTGPRELKEQKAAAQNTLGVLAKETVKFLPDSGARFIENIGHIGDFDAYDSRTNQFLGWMQALGQVDEEDQYKPFPDADPEDIGNSITRAAQNFRKDINSGAFKTHQDPDMDFFDPKDWITSVSNLGESVLSFGGVGKTLTLPARGLTGLAKYLGAGQKTLKGVQLASQTASGFTVASAEGATEAAANGERLFKKFYQANIDKGLTPEEARKQAKVATAKRQARQTAINTAAVGMLQFTGLTPLFRSPGIMSRWGKLGLTVKSADEAADKATVKAFRDRIKNLGYSVPTKSKLWKETKEPLQESVEEVSALFAQKEAAAGEDTSIGQAAERWIDGAFSGEGAYAAAMGAAGGKLQDTLVRNLPIRERPEAIQKAIEEGEIDVDGEGDEGQSITDWILQKSGADSILPSTDRISYDQLAAEQERYMFQKRRDMLVDRAEDVISGRKKINEGAKEDNLAKILEGRRQVMTGSVLGAVEMGVEEEIKTAMQDWRNIDEEEADGKHGFEIDPESDYYYEDMMDEYEQLVDELSTKREEIKTTTEQRPEEAGGNLGDMAWRMWGTARIMDVQRDRLRREEQRTVENVRARTPAREQAEQQTEEAPDNLGLTEEALQNGIENTAKLRQAGYIRALEKLQEETEEGEPLPGDFEELLDTVEFEKLARNLLRTAEGGVGDNFSKDRINELLYAHENIEDAEGQNPVVDHVVGGLKADLFQLTRDRRYRDVESMLEEARQEESRVEEDVPSEVSYMSAENQKQFIDLRLKREQAKQRQKRLYDNYEAFKDREVKNEVLQEMRREYEKKDTQRAEEEAEKTRQDENPQERADDYQQNESEVVKNSTQSAAEKEQTSKEQNQRDARQSAQEEQPEDGAEEDSSDEDFSSEESDSDGLSMADALENRDEEDSTTQESSTAEQSSSPQQETDESPEETSPEESGEQGQDQQEGEEEETSPLSMEEEIESRREEKEEEEDDTEIVEEDGKVSAEKSLAENLPESSLSDEELVSDFSTVLEQIKASNRTLPEKIEAAKKQAQNILKTERDYTDEDFTGVPEYGPLSEALNTFVTEMEMAQEMDRERQQTPDEIDITDPPKVSIDNTKEVRRATFTGQGQEVESYKTMETGTTLAYKSRETSEQDRTRVVSNDDHEDLNRAVETEAVQEGDNLTFRLEGPEEAIPDRETRKSFGRGQASYDIYDRAEDERLVINVYHEDAGYIGKLRDPMSITEETALTEEDLLDNQDVKTMTKAERKKFADSEAVEDMDPVAMQRRINARILRHNVLDQIAREGQATGSVDVKYGGHVSIQYQTNEDGSLVEADEGGLARDWRTVAEGLSELVEGNLNNAHLMDSTTKNGSFYVMRNGNVNVGTNEHVSAVNKHSASTATAEGSVGILLPTAKGSTLAVPLRTPKLVDYGSKYIDGLYDVLTGNVSGKAESEIGKYAFANTESDFLSNIEEYMKDRSREEARLWVNGDNGHVAVILPEIGYFTNVPNFLQDERWEDINNPEKETRIKRALGELYLNVDISKINQKSGLGESGFEIAGDEYESYNHFLAQHLRTDVRERTVDMSQYDRGEGTHGVYMQQATINVQTNPDMRSEGVVSMQNSDLGTEKTSTPETDQSEPGAGPSEPQTIDRESQQEEAEPEPATAEETGTASEEDASSEVVEEGGPMAWSKFDNEAKQGIGIEDTYERLLSVVQAINPTIEDLAMVQSMADTLSEMEGEYDFDPTSVIAVVDPSSVLPDVETEGSDTATRSSEENQNETEEEGVQSTGEADPAITEEEAQNDGVDVEAARERLEEQAQSQEERRAQLEAEAEFILDNEQQIKDLAEEAQNLRNKDNATQDDQNRMEEIREELLKLLLPGWTRNIESGGAGDISEEFLSSLTEEERKFVSGVVRVAVNSGENIELLNQGTDQALKEAGLLEEESVEETIIEYSNLLNESADAVADNEGISPIDSAVNDVISLIPENTEVTDAILHAQGEEMALDVRSRSEGTEYRIVYEYGSDSIQVQDENGSIVELSEEQIYNNILPREFFDKIRLSEVRDGINLSESDFAQMHLDSAIMRGVVRPLIDRLERSTGTPIDQQSLEQRLRSRLEEANPVFNDLSEDMQEALVEEFADSTTPKEQADALREARDSDVDHKQFMQKLRALDRYQDEMTNDSGNFRGVNTDKVIKELDPDKGSGSPDTSSNNEGDGSSIESAEELQNEDVDRSDHDDMDNALSLNVVENINTEASTNRPAIGSVSETRMDEKHYTRVAKALSQEDGTTLSCRNG